MIKNLQVSRSSPLIFVFFVFAINIPNILWLEPSTSNLLQISQFVEKLILCSLLSSLFLVFFKNPLRAWLTMWASLLWWQPLALGTRFLYDQAITPTLIGMGLATSPGELRNLVNVVPWHWLIYFIVWNISCFAIWRILRRLSPENWSLPFRLKICLFSLVILFLPLLILGNGTSVIRSESNFNVDLSHHYKGSFDLLGQGEQETYGSYHLQGAFPYDLAFSMLHYFKARKVVNAVRAKLRSPAPGHTLNGTTPRADIVVLVIGESSTRGAWRFFNRLAPPTTPHLEARKSQGENLYGFSQTLAETTSTRQAVPSLLTAQPLIWPDGAANPNATYSILSVAEDAGYATAWFSNQAAIGKHDGIIASYAEEARSIAFLNPSSFYHRGSLDEVLIPPLRRHLAQNSSAFVVLHTMGSHFRYQDRYPEGFGPYSSSSNDLEAYFNSVAYTDRFLDEVIEVLHQDDRRAVLVYVADHGETVPNGACKTGSAHRNSYEAYEVPALVWLSRSYADAHPELTALLQNHQEHPYTVSAVHQTLLDLMRGYAQESTTTLGTMSFARATRQWDADGHEILSGWVNKIVKATKNNPCFLLFQ